MDPYRPMTDEEIFELLGGPELTGLAYHEKLEHILLTALRQCETYRYGLGQMYLRCGAELIDQERRARGA